MSHITESELSARGIDHRAQAVMRSQGLKARQYGDTWVYAEADLQAFLSRGATTSKITNPAAYRGQSQSGVSQVESTGHFSDVVNERINREMASNPRLTRAEAQQRVLKADPSLRQNWVYEHNQVHQAKLQRR